MDNLISSSSSGKKVSATTSTGEVKGVFLGWRKVNNSTVAVVEVENAEIEVAVYDLKFI